MIDLVMKAWIKSVLIVSTTIIFIAVNYFALSYIFEAHSWPMLIAYLSFYTIVGFTITFYIEEKGKAENFVNKID